MKLTSLFLVLILLFSCSSKEDSKLTAELHKAFALTLFFYPVGGDLTPKSDVAKGVSKEFKSKIKAMMNLKGDPAKQKDAAEKVLSELVAFIGKKHPQFDARLKGMATDVSKKCSKFKLESAEASNCIKQNMMGTEIFSMVGELYEKPNMKPLKK